MKIGLYQDPIKGPIPGVRRLCWFFRLAVVLVVGHADVLLADINGTATVLNSVNS